jgi:hypothetical protein
MRESCETGDAAVVKPVHWTLACLERCVEKMGKYFDDPAHDPTLRIFALETINATQLHPLWRAWFMASRNQIPKLISSTDVWNKILFMSQMVKGLELLDTVAFSRIMQTVIRQVSKDRAPWIAEDMLWNLQNLKVDGGNLHGGSIDFLSASFHCRDGRKVSKRICVQYSSHVRKRRETSHVYSLQLLENHHGERTQCGRSPRVSLQTLRRPTFGNFDPVSHSILEHPKNDPKFSL